LTLRDGYFFPALTPTNFKAAIKYQALQNHGSLLAISSEEKAIQLLKAGVCVFKQLAINAHCESILQYSGQKPKVYDIDSTSKHTMKWLKMLEPTYCLPSCFSK
jgi:hypothetical protein